MIAFVQIVSKDPTCAPPPCIPIEPRRASHPVSHFPHPTLMKSLPPFFRLGLLLLAALPFTGCVSNKYKEAKKDTPPPQLLNVAFASAPLEATLNTVITYNGPGSWKRDAFWDEYVVTLRNPGSQPLTVSAVSLTDFAGALRPDGGDPWALEKQSKTLEQKYHDAGVAFVRYTTPGVLIVGAGAAAIGSAGVFSAAFTTIAGATLIALPVYYAGVLTINHQNKVAMQKEFSRRRLELPLTLAPGETRTGSCFFPMGPNPRSLALHWSNESGRGDTVLPLDFLRGLHIKTAAPTATDK